MPPTDTAARTDVSLNDVRAIIPADCYERPTGRAVVALVQAGVLHLAALVGLALTDRWSRRLPDPITAMASGWMRVRQRARQRNVELPLIISDHADWDELTATIAEVDPAETWITHGREEALL